jgi:hypothetical protein
MYHNNVSNMKNLSYAEILGLIKNNGYKLTIYNLFRRGLDFGKEML